MAHHLLPCTVETVRWGSLSAGFPAVLSVRSGDTLEVETFSGEPENLPGPCHTVSPEHRRILEQCERGAGPHLLTGPVCVEGAEPGDVLEVKILDIQLSSDWGWNALKPGKGLLPGMFDGYRQLTLGIDSSRKLATLPGGGTLSLKPFFGILGVAPRDAGAVLSSIPPGPHGGNIDNRELVVGSTLYLPVFQPGAGFYAGDGHALQGDGEVCLTALETGLTGVFGLRIHKGGALGLPRAETPDSWISMGFDPDLRVAAQAAVQSMMEWIGAETGSDHELIYRLCSLIASLRITQAVNGNNGVHCIVRKDELMWALPGASPRGGQ